MTARAIYSSTCARGLSPQSQSLRHGRPLWGRRHRPSSCGFFFRFPGARPATGDFSTVEREALLVPFALGQEGTAPSWSSSGSSASSDFSDFAVGMNFTISGGRASPTYFATAVSAAVAAVLVVSFVLVRENQASPGDSASSGASNVHQIRSFLLFTSLLFYFFLLFTFFTFLLFYFFTFFTFFTFLLFYFFTFTFFTFYFLLFFYVFFKLFYFYFLLFTFSFFFFFTFFNFFYFFNFLLFAFCLLTFLLFTFLLFYFLLYTLFFSLFSFYSFLYFFLLFFF